MSNNMDMSFETLEAKGEGQVGGRNLGIYLYPNENHDRDEARYDVRYAVETACDELLNYNAIDYYSIKLYDYETNVNYVDGEDDGGTYYRNFKDWVDNNYGAYKGVHLGVTNHTNFANAEVVSKNATAWVANTKAFVGTAGGYDVGNSDVERYKNLAVQEPIHNMVTMDYNYVADMTEGDEHDLGMVTTSGSSTPMITFYERGDTHPTRSHDRSGKGDCENGSVTWDESHTRSLTFCTKEAISHTASMES